MPKPRYPLVGELATQIDALDPGRVVTVNRIIRNSDGTKYTDLDIELTDFVIQVKSGANVAGGALQVQKSSIATNKRSVLYAPDLSKHQIRVLESEKTWKCIKLLIR